MILEQIMDGIKCYQAAMNGKKPEEIILTQNAYDLLKSEAQKCMTIDDAIDDEAAALFEGIPIIIAERSPKYAVLCSGHVHATGEEVKQE